jgi:hypothetical protein
MEVACCSDSIAAGRPSFMTQHYPLPMPMEVMVGGGRRPGPIGGLCSRVASFAGASCGQLPSSVAL